MDQKRFWRMAANSASIIQTNNISISGGVKLVVHIENRNVLVSAATVSNLYVAYPTKMFRQILRNYCGWYSDVIRTTRTIVYGHSVPKIAVLQHIRWSEASYYCLSAPVELKPHDPWIWCTADYGDTRFSHFWWPEIVVCGILFPGHAVPDFQILPVVRRSVYTEGSYFARHPDISPDYPSHSACLPWVQNKQDEHFKCQACGHIAEDTICQNCVVSLRVHYSSCPFSTEAFRTGPKIRIKYCTLRLQYKSCTYAR